ncbi:4469_t:CDS:2, partial [Gigaspora rosea]
MLDNPFISKEIVADLRDKESTSDWDYYKVRNPELPAVEDWLEILQYIRNQFEAIYQDEPVEIEAIEALTNDLPSVSQQQNEALIKQISLQE